MPVESAADLSGFFSADEFSAECSIETKTGVIAPVFGIPDTEYFTDKPGMNVGSSAGPFLAGVAEIAVQRMQLLTAYLPIASVRAEDTLTILAGTYAGNYRIKDIQRDGDLVRLILNKR